MEKYGDRPHQISRLRVILDDIKNELLSDDRLQLLGLVKGKLPNRDYKRLESTMRDEGGEMKMVELFDLLSEKLGEKKALRLFINLFQHTKRRMTHGKHIDKPVFKLLEECLRYIEEREQKTGLREEDGFVNRLEEISSLIRMLVSPEIRAVSICGVRGIGKTSLARKVCRQMNLDHNYMVYRISLRGERQVDEMLLKMLQEFGEVPGRFLPTNEMKVKLVNHLLNVEEDTIFFLDNIDDLCHAETMDTFLSHLRDILNRTVDSKVKFLLTSTNKFSRSVGSEVTSRQASHFAGRLTELELDKLPIDHCKAILQSYIPEDDQETTETSNVLDELSKLCYQTPFIVELVGMRIKNFGELPSNLIKVLRDRSGLARHVPDMQRIVWHSFKALDHDHKDLLLKLCTFPGTFDVQSAAAVIREPDDYGSMEEHALSHLCLLRSRQFVVIDDSRCVSELKRVDHSRAKYLTFHIPSLIRDYLLHKLPKTDGQVNMLRQAELQLRGYFFEFVEQCAHQSETGRTLRDADRAESPTDNKSPVSVFQGVLRRLFHHYSNINYAFQDLSCLHLPDISDKNQFMKSLHLLNFLSPPTIYRCDKDRLNLFERFLERAKAQRNQLWCLLTQLFIAQQHYDYLDTINGFKEAERILQEVETQLPWIPYNSETEATGGKVLLYAHYCFVKAQTVHYRQKYEDASKFIDQALKWFKHSCRGNDLQIVRLYNQLGYIADFREDFKKADFYYNKCFEKARKILGGISHPLLISIALNIGAYHHLAARREENIGLSPKENYRNAARWNAEAIDILKSLYMYESSASIIILMNFASLCMDMRALGDAMIHAIDAKKLADKYKMEDPITRVRATILLGRIFNNIGRDKKRHQSFDEGHRFHTNAVKEFDEVLELCLPNAGKRLTAKDIGKDDADNDVYWDDLCNFPKLLLQMGYNEKSQKVSHMLSRMSLGQEGSSSSDSDMYEDSPEPLLTQQVTTDAEFVRPPLLKEDSVDSAVPFKVLRLDSAGSEDAFLSSIEEDNGNSQENDGMQPSTSY